MNFDLRRPVAEQLPAFGLEDVKADPEAGAAALRNAIEAAEHFRRAANDLRTEKVRSLGDGECFVRTAKDGRTVRAVKTVVPLRRSEGHIYGIPKSFKDENGKWQKEWTYKLTAEGLTRINTFAGLSTLTPPTQIVGGRQVENPYIETAPGNSSVLECVHVRAVCIGRTVTGNLCAVDYHLRWDPKGYLIESLKAVQAKVPEAIWDSKEALYQAKADAGEADTIVFLPYAQMGRDMVGVNADIKHAEVAAKLKEYQQMVKFGERRAVTICRRNAMRHHPGIGVYTVAPQVVGDDLVVNIPVWAWVEDGSMLTETTRAARALMQGESIPEDIAVESVYTDNTVEDDPDAQRPAADADASDIIDEDGHPAGEDAPRQLGEGNGPEPMPDLRVDPARETVKGRGPARRTKEGEGGTLPLE